MKLSKEENYQVNCMIARELIEAHLDIPPSLMNEHRIAEVITALEDEHALQDKPH